MRGCRFKGILFGLMVFSSSAKADLVGVQLVSSSVTVNSPASSTRWVIQPKDVATLIILNCSNPLKGALSMGSHLTANGIFMLVNQAHVIFSSEMLVDKDGIMTSADAMLNQLNARQFFQNKINRASTYGIKIEHVNSMGIVEHPKPAIASEDLVSELVMEEHFSSENPSKNAAGRAIKHGLDTQVTTEPHPGIVLAANISVLIPTKEAYVMTLPKKVEDDSEYIKIKIDKSAFAKTLKTTNASIAILPTLGNQNMRNAP